MKVDDAITTTWMVLKGLGIDRERSPDLEQTVKEVFDTAPGVEFSMDDSADGGEAIKVDSFALTKARPTLHLYGMSDQGFETGARPMAGFVCRLTEGCEVFKCMPEYMTDYHAVLAYDRHVPKEEREKYGLISLGWCYRWEAGL